MLNNKLNKKAVAGLTIFLQVIVMIFVIGILVMAIALTGAEMQDATDDATADAVIGNTTAAIVGATDWFGIFIVIAAVVVLVIMIVLIIQSLRAGGLMGAGGA